MKSFDDSPWIDFNSGVFLSSEFGRCRNFLKNKNKPNPINARPATPPTTPPAIAPTGVFPEDLLSVEGVEVEVSNMLTDDAVVDRVIVEDIIPLVFKNVEVVVVDGFVGSTEETWLQKSLLPAPPSTHLFLQNLMTTMSPLDPPTQ